MPAVLAVVLAIGKPAPGFPETTVQFDF